MTLIKLLLPHENCKLSCQKSTIPINRLSVFHFPVRKMPRSLENDVLPFDFNQNFGLASATIFFIIMEKNWWWWLFSPSPLPKNKQWGRTDQILPVYKLTYLPAVLSWEEKSKIFLTARGADFVIPKINVFL